MVEHLACTPGERPESEGASNVVSMVFKATSRVEFADGSGRLVSHLKPRGTITMKPAGLVPYTLLHTHAESIHCRLAPDFLLKVSDELDKRPLSSPRHHIRLKDTSTECIMTLLAEELQTGGQSGKLYAESLANMVAVRFLEVEQWPRIANSVRTSALPPRVFRRVRERMEADLHLDLGLAAIAAEAGYSRTHFLRMFHASAGMTPHRYLMGLRVDHAKKLLKRRGNRLIDIASSCGFSSQSHMTTVFRRHAGMTPAKFRRSL